MNVASIFKPTLFKTFYKTLAVTTCGPKLHFLSYSILFHFLKIPHPKLVN
jgi:hypothetical protein